MRQSVLNGKRILVVDDEPDVLLTVEEEVRDAAPASTIEKAATYEAAAALLRSNHYDLVVLDLMGVRGFDLLEIAGERGFPVAILTAHGLSPETLKRSYQMKARAYLPKDELGQLVPYLEDVLEYDFDMGWKRLREKLGRLLPPHYWDYV